MGSRNYATLRQNAAISTAEIKQQGDDNRFHAAQTGVGAKSLTSDQFGDRNMITASQMGPGSTQLSATQAGLANALLIRQSDDATHSAAIVLQSGSGNRIVLEQSGSDNQANLTQAGSDNRMTAEQIGVANRLEWAQNGTNLSDLSIIQGGGQTLTVTQSGGR